MTITHNPPSDDIFNVLVGEEHLGSVSLPDVTYVGPIVRENSSFGSGSKIYFAQFTVLLRRRDSGLVFRVKMDDVSNEELINIHKRLIVTWNECLTRLSRH